MPMYKKSMVALLVLGVAILGFSLFGYYEDDAQALVVQEETAVAGARTDSGNQVAVYVTGEVNNPGVVFVDFEARVADAINKCGGLLPTADADKVNMAQTVKDGMQIKVPEKLVKVSPTSVADGGSSQGNAVSASVGKAPGTSGSSSGSEGDLVNINTADIEGLKKLKGIGPAMAQRIIDYREENGAFQSPEDLQKVKGIGKAKFAKLKDQVAI